MSDGHGAGERRAGTHRVAEELIEERGRMLVLYEQAAGVAPYESGKSREEILRGFAQVLVDYIAAGHFGLYERIAEGRERRRGVRELAVDLYPRIAATTEAAVAFNDAFEAGGLQAPSDSLEVRLGELGEQLALRVELEDRLLAALLGGASPDPAEATA